MTPLIAQPLARAAPLDVRSVRGGIEAIDALHGEWSRLCDASQSDEPFYRPEWIRAYVAAFAPHAELVLITVRDEDGLLGVLPLVREIGAIGGLPARKLRVAGNTHTCRYDVTTRGADAAAIVEALW